MSYRCLMAALAVWIGLTASLVQAEIIYNTIPSPLPGNISSLGYQATSTSQLGDRIAFGGTARSLDSVTVTMSSWALNSNYPSMGADGFYHPITLNLYSAVDNSLIATQTQNVLVPWRPEVFAFNGIAFNVTFDFTGVQVPDELIYGIAYNTQSYGDNPLGSPGPYNSLNFGLTLSSPTVGTDLNPASLYWDSTFGGRPAGFNPGNVGGNYTPTIQFNASAAEVPEPASLAVWGLVSMAGAAYGWRKRRALKANG